MESPIFKLWKLINWQLTPRQFPFCKWVRINFFALFAWAILGLVIDEPVGKFKKTKPLFLIRKNWQEIIFRNTTYIKKSEKLVYIAN